MPTLTLIAPLRNYSVVISTDELKTFFIYWLDVRNKMVGKWCVVHKKSPGDHAGRVGKRRTENTAKSSKK